MNLNFLTIPRKTLPVATACLASLVMLSAPIIAQDPSLGANHVAGNLITFNPDGGWCWYQDERTIVNNGQLVIGSVASPSGDVTVTVYELASKRSTVVPLHEGFQSDDHDTPALLVLPDGRYLAVYSKHGNDRFMRWRISVEPGDATRWQDEQTIDAGARTTYANVFRLSEENGRIYNFQRGIGWDPNFMISDDNAKSWRYGGHLLENANDPNSRMRPYLKYAGDNKGAVHFVATEAHPHEFPGTSLYHGFYRGGSVYGSDGTRIASIADGPAEPTRLTKVFSGDATNSAWTSDLHLDSQGNPFIAYSVHKSNTDHRYRYARWAGNRWNDHEIAFAGTGLYRGEDDYTGNIALDPNNPDSVFISTDADPVSGSPLMSRGDGKRHYEIFRGETMDSGATWKWTPVTQNSTMDNLRPIVPIWNQENTAVLWLRGSYTSYTNYRLSVVGLVYEAEQHLSEPVVLRASDAVVDRWRDMRLGMFIHWGPVALKGTEIGWSRGREVPIEEYDQLYKQFRAEQFNPTDWANLAKQAGFKYLILTAKHHDGFSLWDTHQTDFNVVNSPLQRDVTKELGVACREAGLAFGTYYSICDWRHPDYPLGSPGGKSRKASPNMDRYEQFLRAQLSELNEQCGPLFCLWFDGEWESPWTHKSALELNNWLHRKYPDLIVNNRVGKGRRGMQGLSDPAANPGDFWTPEQEVGAFHREFPWETCMTLCRQWAWKPDDQLKSLEECLDILVNTICGDGNLLLNVGPMPDGRIEPRQAQRLVEIGNFVNRYADAIYGTRGGPFIPGKWGGSTCKGNEIFLFLRDTKPGQSIRLPGIGSAKAIRASDYSGNPVEVRQTSGELTVTPPSVDSSTGLVVVRIELNGSSVEIPPVAVRSE